MSTVEPEIHLCPFMYVPGPWPSHVSKMDVHMSSYLKTPHEGMVWTCCVLLKAGPPGQRLSLEVHLEKVSSVLNWKNLKGEHEPSLMTLQLSGLVLGRKLLVQQFGNKKTTLSPGRKGIYNKEREKKIPQSVISMSFSPSCCLSSGLHFFSRRLLHSPLHTTLFKL